jgi:hypothetical protein
MNVRRLTMWTMLDILNGVRHDQKKSTNKLFRLGNRSNPAYLHISFAKIHCVWVFLSSLNQIHIISRDWQKTAGQSSKVYIYIYIYIYIVTCYATVSTSDTKCDVLRHCRHRSDCLTLYSQSHTFIYSAVSVWRLLGNDLDATIER